MTYQRANSNHQAARQPILLLLSTLLAAQSAYAVSEHLQDNVKLRAQHAQAAGDALPVPSPRADQSLRIKRDSAPDAGVSPPAAANPTLDRGKFFSRHGEYKEAMDFFTRAATADPKNAEPYNRRARAEWQLDQLDNALEDARFSIQLNPDYAEAFCTRAAILNSMGHYNEAIADAALTSELKPTLREAYTIEASAYRNLRQFSEADAVLAKLNSVANPESAFDEWAPDIDYTPYLGYVQATIRQHWQPQQGNYSPIVILFKVHRNGQISDLKINNAGDATADNAALQAARSSGPFQQPPAGAPPDFDVFVVLEPAPKQSTGQVPPAPASPSHVSSNPIAGMNWSGKINQGLSIMQRYILHP